MGLFIRRGRDKAAEPDQEEGEGGGRLRRKAKGKSDLEGLEGEVVVEVRKERGKDKTR